MNKTITVTAKTYDEAITKALIELQTTFEHLHIDVVQEATNGFLGVIGGKPYILNVRVMTEEEEAAKRKAKEEELAKKKAENAAAGIDETSAGTEGTGSEGDAVREERRSERRRDRRDGDRRSRDRRSDRPEKGERAEKPERTERPERAERQERAEKNSRPERISKQEVQEAEAAQAAQIEAAAKKEAERVKKVVSEEEAAALQKKAEDFLKELFKTMEAEVETSSSFDHDENELSVLLSGEDMGIFIGKRGQTLDSLQYLTSLVVNKHHDGYIRVKLDTENYRERREEKLKALAKNISYKVKRTRKPVSLEPMNPYERRIIHSALQGDPYVTTYSEGEDPYRHIVVVLKKDTRRQRG